MYKLTYMYDNDPKDSGTFEYDDALQAFEAFARCKDFGMADEISVYNLTMPNGKMYTKIFDRTGLVAHK